MKSFEISSIFARLDVLNGILNRISQFTINAYILAVYLKEGGGSVFTLMFFVVKLDFKIAVDQQTRAHDHAHVWLIFGPILPNHLNMLKTMNTCI